MDKMKMHTPNMADENYRKLAALFPNAVTESIDPETGEVVRAIDADVLRQEISGRVVEGREERYQFTWPDKKKAMLAANAPIAATLRPVRADSVGRDGTPGGWDSENLYIEGDNLDVLKLLQETYLGKVQIIYIDPPYNTGNDLVYEDDFTEDLESYLDRSGQFDDQGNRLGQNTDSNGRFHTDWLNMIYPRLKMAKNLLADDGLIIISIDDNELDNMIKCCNEVFGAQCFINCFIWKRNSSGKTEVGKFTVNTEYVLLYAKTMNYTLVDTFKPLSDSSVAMYSKDDHDGRGKYATVSLQKPGNPGPETTYDYIDNTGKVWPCPPKGWRMTYEKVKALENDGRLYFEGKNLRVKDYWNERASAGKRIDTLWNDLPENTTGSKQLQELFGILGVFSNPKPVELIKRCLSISGADSLVMDFFSGSATTAHAVMQLNAEDGGHRKFIMVQLPEKTDESSEAYKAGYPNICEIGKERIRRAGRKIREEFAMRNAQCVIDTDNSELRIKNYELSPLDIGFRVLRLDSSNMQDVYYNPAAMTQDLLDLTTDNIKPDRTPEDLLFQVMLDLGVELSSKIVMRNVECVMRNQDPTHQQSITNYALRITHSTYTYYDVADGFLIACFDKGITSEVVTEIAKRQPYYAVFRDSSMADDSTATNFDQIFETYSQNTVRKVL